MCYNFAGEEEKCLLNFVSMVYLTLHFFLLYSSLCDVFCCQALIVAWDSDQRVKALKIAIQVCTEQNELNEKVVNHLAKTKWLTKTTAHP